MRDKWLYIAVCVIALSVSSCTAVVEWAKYKYRQCPEPQSEVQK